MACLITSLLLIPTHFDMSSKPTSHGISSATAQGDRESIRPLSSPFSLDTAIPPPPKATGSQYVHFLHLSLSIRQFRHRPRRPGVNTSTFSLDTAISVPLLPLLSLFYWSISLPRHCCTQDFMVFAVVATCSISLFPCYCCRQDFPVFAVAAPLLYTSIARAQLT
jgi:hypothetical protein